MARSFNGSTDYASATLNLSGVQKATLAFWFWKDSFANDDQVALEHSPNFNLTPGFIVDPNAASGSFEIDLSSGGAYCQAKVTRPSASAWHHYAATFDRTLGPGGQVTGI
ncbi:MAG TPA: LamG-like jellyroll fold domain-containing protein, partial [Gemmataceae bacterium]|nr:LamG-like jellyroll fold domain-containing protein [Gemmataceae bacterium]